MAHTKTGIHPLNPGAIPDLAYLLSTELSDATRSYLDITETSSLPNYNEYETSSLSLIIEPFTSSLHAKNEHLNSILS
ncbi:hypothetical protein DPMN_045226 [Dreissena polymorpha]|uniref:Uncharacterized protein n=1 Tax=Dreissena polymorpha TaxID=45954 RepID=A0A9D4D7D4_DREPO|nr:hypothetical protein DPMN_045226 [Dreissena polymorpha]